MRRPLTTAALTAALLFSASACSDDDDKKKPLSGDEKQTVEALTTNLTAGSTSETAKSQADCISRALVDDLGVEKLQKSGLVTKDFVGRFGAKVDRPTAEAIGDAVVKCYDVEAQISEMKKYYPKADEADWTTYVACVDKLDGELRTSVVEANIEGGNATLHEGLSAKVAACAKPLGQPVDPSATPAP